MCLLKLKVGKVCYLRKSFAFGSQHKKHAISDVCSFLSVCITFKKKNIMFSVKSRKNETVVAKCHYN